MTQPFSKMNKLELIEYCRSLYNSGGIEALSYTALSKQGALYTNLYRHGLKQKELVAQLGLHDQYQAYKKSTPIVRKDGRLIERWTWERILQEAKSVKAQHGHLPPAAWFQSNGYGSLVQAVYYLDRTWEALREEVGDFEGSSFVESRNGLRWRSHPEAALSNFLYARGVEHKRGERYPADFAKRSTSKYAYYDMHFLARNQVWIDVEIWGDRPNGHDEVRYKEKRQLPRHTLQRLLL